MNIRVLSKELSEELEISALLIEQVGSAQFKLVRDTIRDGDWEAVYLQYLGKFAVKPSRMKSVEDYERCK